MFVTTRYAAKPQPEYFTLLNLYFTVSAAICYRRAPLNAAGGSAPNTKSVVPSLRIDWGATGTLTCCAVSSTGSCRYTDETIKREQSSAVSI
jgi:hypothetical protein